MPCRIIKPRAISRVRMWYLIKHPAFNVLYCYQYNRYPFHYVWLKWYNALSISRCHLLHTTHNGTPGNSSPIWARYMLLGCLKVLPDCPRYIESSHVAMHLASSVKILCSYIHYDVISNLLIYDIRKYNWWSIVSTKLLFDGETLICFFIISQMGTMHSFCSFLMLFSAVVLKATMSVTIACFEMLSNYKPRCTDELCIELVLMVARPCKGDMSPPEKIMMTFDNG